MSDAKTFAAIFDGLKSAYGTFSIDSTKSNGKNTGRARVVHEPRTLAHYEKHLSGEGVGIGIIPINEENSCKWGCIDIDEYPLDHKRLIDKIRAAKLPLVVCRSKSGGAHCFLFTQEWITAEDMRKTLQHIASALGYGSCEIFPKQIKLFLERGDVGNFLNMPYFNAEEGLRYAINDDGSAATLEEFFELYKKYVQTTEQVDALTKQKIEDTPIVDGPPCLQTLCAQKIAEGGRNNGLFNIGVYLRKAHPDNWQDEILSYNMAYIDPPLPLSEVNLVVKQLEKKDYAFRCSDSPIQPYCNKDVCQTRKFGIGAAVSDMAIANLRKYNSIPPVWFLDVNGVPLELDTEALQNQTIFQKACIEQLNMMPQTIAKRGWESRINQLMKEMSETDGAIMEVSEDASINGQFYEYLDEFCTSTQRAEDREEILLRRPWLDEDSNAIHFRLKDFEGFLRKNRFTEFKTHKVAQRLRDINGDSVLLKIKGKPVRVWKIPVNETPQGTLRAPRFTGLNSEQAPF
jgi:hypothetical protein